MLNRHANSIIIGKDILSILDQQLSFTMTFRMFSNKLTFKKNSIKLRFTYNHFTKKKFFSKM